MFIARVSRGRTVREFLISVLLVPTVVSVLWMTTFGGTAIDQATVQNLVGVKDAVLELKLFAMLGELPLKEITVPGHCSRHCVFYHLLGLWFPGH